MPSNLRERILQASREVVAAQGPGALSIREIARQAGVSHQAPYKHFRDREEILATLLLEGMDGLATALEAAGEDPQAVGRAYVRWALANPGPFRLLFRPDMVATGDPRVQEAGARAWACLERLSAALAGSPAEREVIAARLWSLAHGLATLLLDGPLPAQGSSLDTDTLAERVLGGVLAPATHPSG